jgi:hypothetical protein
VITGILQVIRHSLAKSIAVDVATIPVIPYSDVVPIVRPIYLEQIQALIFVQLHAIVFNRSTRVIIASPFSQQLFGVFFSNYDQV